LPERPNPSFAHLVVRVRDVTEMDEVMQWGQGILGEHLPGVRAMFRRNEITTGTATKIEARFSGPDAITLRELGESALQVYLTHGLVDRSTDWYERELALVPDFDEARARQLGVSRTEVANSLAFATNGVQVGLLRDEDKLVPITVRLEPRAPGLDQLSDQLIWSEKQQRYIPARQVIADMALQPVDATIMRRNRVRTLTARANAPPGVQAATAFREVRSEIESIALPPGYRFEWGGEYEANRIANESVGIRFPIGVGVMMLTTLLMFGRVRQAAVIWLSVPLVLCGVTLALHMTGLSFTFPALLGLLSLVGILIKNSVVLVEEIDYRINRENSGFFPSIISACISRLRPVMLAAGTTLAGMSPLLNDSFFREMAVTIMGGLAVGSTLSLISVPVIYAILHPRRAARS
jgi:multidrug efflux pump subunit AcrB